jgi:hypothetical protein
MARQTQRRQAYTPPEWNFRTFPVAYAFFVGMFISTLLYPIGLIIFIVSVFGTSFCTAHAISHWLRRRTLDKRAQQAEEDERERRALAARAAAGQDREAAAAAARKRRRRR